MDDAEISSIDWLLESDGRIEAPPDDVVDRVRAVAVQPPRAMSPPRPSVAPDATPPTSPGATAGTAERAGSMMERMDRERTTGTDVLPDERTDPRLDEDDHDRFAHYVDKSKLTEAYVLGTPVIALCGKVWVPSRDPSRFPVCPECKRLYEMGPQGRAREWARREGEV